MPNGAAVAMLDLHHLAEAAAVLAGAAGVGAVLLLPDHQRGDGLGDLDRHVAHARREGRGAEAVLAGARAGAAGVEGGDLEGRVAAADRAAVMPCPAASFRFHRLLVPSAGTRPGQHLVQGAVDHVGQHVADGAARVHRRRPGAR